MGTRGFVVVSRKGRFFCIYNHFDSYPDALGCEVVSGIPQSPAKYQTWLLNYRKTYDQKIEQKYRPRQQGDELLSARPVQDLFIEYLYEIDLDTETFWVNGFPMFRLDCMPSSEVFLEVLSRDRYGHYITKATMPEKHRYIKSSPSPPSAESLDAYKVISAGSDNCVSSWQELLGVEESLSSLDRVRLRVFEVFVGYLMRIDEFASPLLASEVGREPFGVPPFVEEAAVKLVLLAFRPILFHEEIRLSVNDEFKKFDSDYVWVRPAVCVKAAFHLDDEDTFRASIGDLVGHIRGTSKEGLVYGVLCSLFHCVLIKVDMAAGGKMTHTPAMEFLPSRFATSPSTPGLTSLFKVVTMLDDTLFDAILTTAPENWSSPSDSPTHFDKLPTELIKQIASLLISPTDLLCYGTLNEATRAAATAIFSVPFFYVFRLSSISDQPVSDRWYYGDEYEEADDDQGGDDDDAAEDNAATDTRKVFDRTRLCVELFHAVDTEGKALLLKLNSLRQWDRGRPKLYLFQAQGNAYATDFLAIAPKKSKS